MKVIISLVILALLVTSLAATAMAENDSDLETPDLPEDLPEEDSDRTEEDLDNEATAEEIPGDDENERTLEDPGNPATWEPLPGSGSSDNGENDEGTSSTGSSGTCRTVWICEEWSECVDGQRTRTCVKKVPGCTANQEPTGKDVCEVELQVEEPVISVEEPTPVVPLTFFEKVYSFLRSLLFTRN